MKSGISTHLEFAVVLIEAVLLIGFAVPLWAKRVNQFPETRMRSSFTPSASSLTGIFIYRGPMGSLAGAISLLYHFEPARSRSKDPAAKDDIVVSGELHVPVDRPVIIELSSKDVIHNFCLPSMRIAQDAIPGQIIPMWFKPIKKGTYEVVCGQLCGSVITA